MAAHERIRVVFLRDIPLPRFNIHKGMEWECRKVRVTSEGFPIAGGFVEKKDYLVIRD